MNINEIKVNDQVTPVSPKNHAYREVKTVTEIWPVGRGGKEGRILCGKSIFLPSQLRKV